MADYSFLRKYAKRVKCYFHCDKKNHKKVKWSQKSTNEFMETNTINLILYNMTTSQQRFQ